MLDEQKQVQAITKLFDTVASRYDCPSLRFFPMVADQLVAQIRPKRDTKHLDIATGTGMVAIAACEALGAGGRVTGIDISDNMLLKAEKNLAHRGHRNIDFHLMDAGDLEFKDNYFDSASCSFGIFFLPNPAKALKSWRRVLKPGATLGLTTFGLDAMMPMMGMFLQQLEFIGIAAHATRKLDVFRDPTYCMTLLKDAGFQQVQADTKQFGYHLASPNDWWELLYHSGTRGLIDQIPEEKLADFKQQHLDEIATQQKEDGIWLNLPIHFFLGNK